ncbi:hypothetical protein Bcop_1082 [Bacteroides coprosuis DSM 18011]|uniref:Transmembrane protein n=1 Tax=Bacteroides coprosuis DSM 18011 TaxID=679937 RepID=F3ZTQ8_9BACE|nr:hypothetical protein [Bacteroides coprosuis]EGJ71289.1 hypothetical protein Bcop_1082 [Bacteroides coprosuis DSM 18011]
MRTTRIKQREFKNSVAHSWALFALGGVSLLTGLWALFAPTAALTSGHLFFILSIILIGVLHYVYMRVTRTDVYEWSWGIAAAIFGVIIGLVMTSKECTQWNILSFYLAIWGFVQFFIMLTIISVIKNRKFVNWIIILVCAIAGLALSTTLIVNPIIASSKFIVSSLFIIYAMPHFYYAIQVNRVQVNISNN